jgi:hypothetical protein
MNKEAAYWISISTFAKCGALKINNLIIKIFHENNISIEDFFNYQKMTGKIIMI